MLAESALRDMTVMFATPCYAGQTASPYTASVFALGSDCTKMGLSCELKLYSESLVPRARNLLVTQFLASRFSHIFFIDADIMFTSAAVFRCLLVDHDVSAGIYPIKQFEWPPESGITMEQWQQRQSPYPFFPVEKTSDTDGFVRVYPVTSGFLCIKRAAIERMILAYPDRKYVSDRGAIDTRPHYDFFPAMIEPSGRRYWSEDYGFSWLWNQIGGDIWADSESCLNHYGQHMWHGDLPAHLEAKGLYAEAAE